MDYDQPWKYKTAAVLVTMFIICNVSFFFILLQLPIAGRPSAHQHSNVFPSHMEMPWSINFYGPVLVFIWPIHAVLKVFRTGAAFCSTRFQPVLLNGCLLGRRQARKLPSGSTSPHLAVLPTFHLHICETKGRSNNIMSCRCTLPARKPLSDRDVKNAG